MHWKSRKNPALTGEGEVVHSAKKASEICAWHNIWFPDHKHWYEAETPADE